MAFLSPPTQHITSLLDRCSNMEELKQIHAQILKTGLVCDSVAASKLLAFSCSPNTVAGNLSYTHMSFERISRSNTFMWNAMIRAYSNSNEPEQALFLYHQMLRHSVPHNSYTFPLLLKACSGLSAVGETQQVHALVIKFRYDKDVYAMNSLLHAYAALGSMASSRRVFDRMPRQDIVSWNSMIDGYMKCGETEAACEVFEEMPAKNAISWTTIISGYVQAGLNKEALELFQEMQVSGVGPDNVALTSVLSACACLGALDQGRWIHAYINKNGIHVDAALSCALIDMYAKSGNMEEALEVFAKTKRKYVSTWTAIVSGFAVHGEGRKALYWFTQMQMSGMKPNLITFTAILSACSYAGLIVEGKMLFESMESVHNLTPTIEHYGCMVDLLGRAGYLKEAINLVQRMPLKPNAIIFGALLNACSIHGNLELGKQIGKTLVEMDSKHGGRYVHLASIHAAAGEWDLAAEARKQMKDSKIHKLPGCSTIRINGTVHEFLAGDRYNPHMKEIYSTWKQIHKKLSQEGYKTSTRDLLLDLEDDEKESAINQHSEKLAVTFGLIRTKPGTAIRIFKNLRVCEDCHVVMKLISEIYGREIIMRDRTRFHVFNDGKCTCCDYW